MKKLLLAFALFASLSSSQTAIAATLTWDNDAGTNNWHGPTNWSTDALPTNADLVQLDASNIAGDYTVVVDQTGAVADSLNIYAAAGQQITLDVQTGGRLTFTGVTARDSLNINDGGQLYIKVDGTLEFEQNNTTGRVCIGHSASNHNYDAGSEGSTTVIDVNGTLTFGSDGEVHFAAGNASTLTLNINPGATLNNHTLSYIENFSFGYPGLSSGHSSTVTANQTGGDVVLNTDYFTIGNAARINTTYNMSGGTMMLNIGNPGTYRGLVLGLFSGAYGELNMSNATNIDVNVGLAGSDKNVYVGHNGYGTLSMQDSASLNVAQGSIYIGETSTAHGNVYQRGASTITVSGNIYVGFYNNGTYHFESGTTTVPGLMSIGHQNGSVGILNMSGGTLNITGELLMARRSGAVATTKQTGGTISAEGLRFYANSQGNGTYELDGGRLELGNTGIVQGTGAPGTVSLELDGGTLAVRAGSTGWSCSMPATLNKHLSSDNVTFEPKGTAPITWSGELSGAAGFNLQATDAIGELNLDGNHSYQGKTVVKQGVLNIDGQIYQNADANIEVKSGALLRFSAAASVGLAATPKLTLNMEDGASLLIANNVFAGNDLQLTLAGSYKSYGSKFIRQKITANQLGALTIANGTRFEIEIDEATEAADLLVVTGTVAMLPSDLTVMVRGYKDAKVGDWFDVLESESGVITTDGSNEWTPGVVEIGGTIREYGGFEIEYYYKAGLLYAVYVFHDTTEAIAYSNPLATAKFLYGPNMTGDSYLCQQKIRAEVNPKKQDQIVQQFTPSMAVAQVTAAVQVNSQVLQTVAQQTVVPWSNAGSMNILRANNRRSSSSHSRFRSRSNINTWLQGFGYAGEQAVKDNFAGYKNDGVGFVAGMDKTFGPRIVTGLAYGYAETSLDSSPFITGSETPSSVNTTGHSLVGYALLRTSATTFISLKAGNTWFGVSGMRRPFTSDPSKIYTYETDANTWFLQASLGWQWLKCPLFSVTPKAKLGYFSYSQDAYQEIRPGLFPANVAAYDNGYAQADFLLDSKLFLTKDVTLSVSAGYRGLIGADGAVLGYAADGGSYNVNGVSSAEHQLVLDTGAILKLTRSLMVITEYNYRTGQGSYIHGGTGTLVLSF